MNSLSVVLSCTSVSDLSSGVDALARTYHSANSAGALSVRVVLLDGGWWSSAGAAVVAAASVELVGVGGTRGSGSSGTTGLVLVSLLVEVTSLVDVISSTSTE